MDRLSSSKVAQERLTRHSKVRHSFSLVAPPGIDASARISAVRTIMSTAVGINPSARNIGATVRASMSRNSGAAVVNASMGTSDCCPSNGTIHINGERGASFSLADLDHGGRFGNGNTKSDCGRG